jgi:hypothetical protein
MAYWAIPVKLPCTTKLPLLAMICAILAAGPAVLVRAEDRGTPEQQAACRPDVLRLCGPEIPDVQRITMCLRYYMKKLSPECAAVIAEKRR